MSLISLLKICCDGIEEPVKPNALSLHDDGLDFSQNESSHSSFLSPDIKAHNALRIKHEKSIFSAPFEPDDELLRNFECEAHLKSTDEESLLKNAFREHTLFDDLNEVELNEIVCRMEMIDVVAGKELDGEFLYVVQTGCLLYFCENKRKVSNKVSDGELFCEMDLLYGGKTPNAIIAGMRSTLWRLNYYTYRSVLAKHTLKADADIKTCLRKIELFEDLSEQTINKFADSLTRVCYKEGDRIISKGEPGEIFYVIEEGRVRVHDIGIGDSQCVDQIMEHGDAFGERALLTGEPRAANVTAVSDVTTLVMDRATFNESIGVLGDRMDFCDRLHTIKGLSIFAESDLTQIELESLAEKIGKIFCYVLSCQLVCGCQPVTQFVWSTHFKWTIVFRRIKVVVCYKVGTKLVKVGSPYPPNLWMIRSGALIVYGSKSDTIHKMQGGDYFGDKSISNPVEHISSHDATCETNINAYLLTREDIESVVIDLDRLGDTSGFVKQKYRTTIEMNDLKKHRILGQGGFGTVWLCTSKKDNNAFALKVINKRKVLQEKQERSLLREKELLFMLHHPFILHIVSSFQDKTNCYLVLPVIQGGELYSYVAKETEKGNRLSISHAAFYAAQIIEGLGHFHRRFIAYRDLKLENVSARGKYPSRDNFES